MIFGRTFRIAILSSLAIVFSLGLPTGIARQAAPEAGQTSNALVERAAAIVDSDPDAALRLTDVAIRNPEHYGDVTLARAYWIRTRALSHKGEYEKAVDAGEQALDLASPDNLAFRVEVLTIMSSALVRNNQSRRAYDLLQEALSVQEMIGDVKGQAASLTALAELYFDVGLREQSRVHYRKALAQARASGDEYVIVVALNNYAFALLIEGDPATAAPMLSEAKTRAGNLGNSRISAFVNQNMGHALVRLGRLQEAEPLINAALAYARENGPPELMTGVHLAMARLEFSRGALGEAEDHAVRALTFAHQSNYSERISDLNKILSEIAIARGDYELAANYLLEHIDYLEAVTNSALERSASLFTAHQELLEKRQELALSRQQAEISRLELARARAVRNGAVLIAVSLAFLLFVAVLFIREKLAAKRALEQKNTEILAAYADVDRANKAKSQFLSVMSHELRTPLNSVIGFSDIIEAEKLGPVGCADYKTFAHHIHDQGVRLLRMVENILLITNSEAGKLKLHEEPNDINELYQAAIQIASSTRSDSDARLSPLADQTDVAALQCDASLLSRAMAQLLNNALKFTSGPVASWVDVNYEGGFVFTVADEGPGFDQQSVPDLLSPFRQADGSFSRTHEGAGLGLPVARLVAEIHGGMLTIETSKTGGTKAAIVIPKERLRPGRNTGEAKMAAAS